MSGEYVLTPLHSRFCLVLAMRQGVRSTGQLEKGIGADRSTTERLLLAVGARKSDVAEEWTLNPL